MSRTVAVIHPDPAVADTIATALRAGGLRPATASLEDDALALLRDEKPSVVVCSTQLDVFTAARRAHRGQVQLIALSSNGHVPYNRPVFRSFRGLTTKTVPIADIVAACLDAFELPPAA